MSVKLATATHTPIGTTHSRKLLRGCLAITYDFSSATQRPPRVAFFQRLSQFFNELFSTTALGHREAGRRAAIEPCRRGS